MLDKQDLKSARVSGGDDHFAAERPLIGAHLKTGGGLHLVPDRADAIGAQAVQIFPSSPRRWRPHVYPEDQLDALKDGLRERRAPLFVHSIYLINLASPDEHVRRQSAGALGYALAFGRRTGAKAVVTHVGSHKGDGFPAGLERVVRCVAEAVRMAREEVEPPLPTLLLEGSAGAPNTLGRTVAELSVLIGEIPVEAGMCLDSAHLFAAGVPAHTPEGLDHLLEEVDAHVGLAGLQCFHLNDSRNPFGSGRDQHANLGLGEIGDAGLIPALRHPSLRDVPFILEVPGLDDHGPDQANVLRAKRLRRS